MTPLAVLNSTLDTIPPGGAMEPVGVADANGRIAVRKPTASDSLAVLLNGPTPILAGQAGGGFLPWMGPLAAAIDPASLDADGGLIASVVTLGTLAGSWYLHPGRLGFVPQAGPVGGLMPVQAVPGVLGGFGFGSGSGGDDETCVVDICLDGAGGGFVRKQTRSRATGATLDEWCEAIPVCGSGDAGGLCDDLPPDAGSGSGSGGGGSGSGSGGGGDLVPAPGCCPDPGLPEAWTITLDGGNGFVTMTYDGSTYWTGSKALAGCTVNFRFDKTSCTLEYQREGGAWFAAACGAPEGQSCITCGPPVGGNSTWAFNATVLGGGCAFGIIAGTAGP